MGRQRSFKAVFCAAVLTVFISQAIAETTLPEWQEGYWWAIQTTLDVAMRDPDSSSRFEMVIQDDSPVYLCKGNETRQLSRGQMNVVDVYVLDFEGTVSGEGIAYIDVYDFPVPVQLRDGFQTGETWVATDSLGTVYVTRTMTGTLWANIFFIWRQVGDIHIRFSEEYEPSRDAANFPVAVGNQWNSQITLFFYGDFELNYDVGEGPETMAGEYDDSVSFALDFEVSGMETYKTWKTFRIEATDPAWPGQFLARYAESAKNYAYLSLTDLEMPDQGVMLREITMDLTEFGFEPPPTPTPTPDYSKTGVTLHLNRKEFEPGDMFRLSRTLVNAGSAMTVDEYLILDVYGNYWFWPEWSESVSFQARSIPAMTVFSDETALTFFWPVTDGSADNLRFWGAMFDPEAQLLYGDYDVVSWGYR